MLFREHGYEHSRISQIIAAGAVNGSWTVVLYRFCGRKSLRLDHRTDVNGREDMGNEAHVAVWSSNLARTRFLFLKLLELKC